MLDRVKLIALGSIGIGGVVLALKAGAYGLTGSSGLYSDALESVVNVVASIVAAAALFYAARPADKNHPYGHEKAEFFAAVIVGVLIIVAALSIFEHAWAAWNDAVPLRSAGRAWRSTRGRRRSTSSGRWCLGRRAAAAGRPR